MQPPPVKRPLSAAKILIIDDDLVFVRLVAHALEQRHYKVETAADGYEGLSKFETIHPNLVLCDLNMPGLTGFQVLNKLRKLSDEVPIIVISGADKIQDAVEAMKCGAWDYLEKPIENFDILLDSVTKSLRKASLVKENGMLRAQLEKLVRIQDQELNMLNAELRAVSSALDFGFCATDNQLQVLRHSTALLRLLDDPNKLIVNRTLAEAFSCTVNSTCLICEHEPCPFRRALGENSPVEAIWSIGERHVKLKILPVSDGDNCEGVFVLTETVNPKPEA